MTKPSQVDLNEEVRALLAERGDDGCAPRHTLFFFFYGGEFEQLAEQAARKGYRAHRTSQRDGVVLEICIAVDEPSFASHLQQMEAWAEEFGCQYDGWECQLMTH